MNAQHIEQKYVRVSRNIHAGNMWLLGESGSSSYLASQCGGDSGLEKDLRNGWLIKFCFEDKYQIVFILERLI